MNGQDEQIRRVLLDALPRVVEVEAARSEITRRVRSVEDQDAPEAASAAGSSSRPWLGSVTDGPPPRSGRSRWLAAAVGLVLVAAAFGVIRFLNRQPTDAPPIIGATPEASPSPSDQTTQRVADPCQQLQTSGTTERFLSEWTRSHDSLRADRCVLPGRVGPEPRFDASGLGTEQRLRPGELSADVSLPVARPERRVDGYPHIHLGRIGTTDAHAFLNWQYDRLRRPVACVGTTCSTDEAVASRFGGLGVGSGSGLEGSQMFLDVWVAPEASVVAVAIDGEPVVWQRPVSRTASFIIDDYQPGPVVAYQVTVFDRDGTRIAAYSGDVTHPVLE